ncbi:YggT family protein [Methylobacterium sp. J-070]|uniref:YggT family protein n=1 Tax=Methylobacterium sp. J-070 TaxID=2836650 RepID=UPI001FB8E378|nr:YggT family protein [Methylobacterium sp. J-070]MCJ2054102.1 YggT family protein [Methylobacterium sp. J-070]
MYALLWLINTVIQLFIYVLIASAVLSWLVAFNVVNVRNPVVAQIGEVLYRLTEPALRPIRNLLPNLGGVDISPIILILLLLFVQRLITVDLVHFLI